MTNIDPALSYAASQKSAALSAPVDALSVGAAMPGSSPAPTATGGGNYDVRQLQQWLKDRGYYPYKVDGWYGPKTTAAVKAFQADAKAAGLYPYAVDGKWGPKTQDAANGWGSTGAGGQPSAAAPTTDAGPAAAAATERTTQETAMMLYGWLASFLDHPEIGSILRSAADEEWSAERLQAALYATNWWRTTQASQRQWLAREEVDEATTKAEVVGLVERLRTTLNELGVSIEESRLRDVARNSLMFGWNDDQIVDALYAESQRNPTVAGQIMRGSYAEQVRRSASDMGLPMSDQAVEQWATQLAFGQASGEQFAAWLSNAASGQYPHFADDIGRGFTVRQLADPYVQLAADTLQMDPDAIDFADPLWNAAINAVDPKTGQRRAMTHAEWGDFLRRDPRYGWDYTEEAVGRAYAAVATLKDRFGR